MKQAGNEEPRDEWGSLSLSWGLSQGLSCLLSLLPCCTFQITFFIDLPMTRIVCYFYCTCTCIPAMSPLPHYLLLLLPTTSSTFFFSPLFSCACQFDVLLFMLLLLLLFLLQFDPSPAPASSSFLLPLSTSLSSFRPPQRATSTLSTLCASSIKDVHSIYTRFTLTLPPPSHSVYASLSFPPSSTHSLHVFGM